MAKLVDEHGNENDTDPHEHIFRVVLVRAEDSGHHPKHRMHAYVDAEETETEIKGSAIGFEEVHERPPSVIDCEVEADVRQEQIISRIALWIGTAIAKRCRLHGT